MTQESTIVRSPEAGRSAPGRVHASARERLRLGILGAFASTAVYLACVWLAYRDVALPITVATIAFIAVTVAIFLFTRSRWMREEWTSAIGAVLLMAMAMTLVYSFTQVRTPAFTVFIALHVLSAGAMHSHTRWLLTGLAVDLVSWLTAGFVLLGADFALAAAALTVATIIAVIVHLMVTRYLGSVEHLRARDQQHHAELAIALAAAQRELTERQRAEAERERLRQQLLHAQKLEAIGTLAGGVAHDMNNVLAAILGLAECLRERGGAAAGEEAEQIIASARRGAELTRNLLGFGQRGQYRLERLDPAAVVANVVALLSRTLPKGIDIAVDGTADHGIEGDSAQLTQVLVNLCLNSSDAMNGHGHLRIQTGEVAVAGERVAALGLPEGSFVTLTVTDTGCGMDRATQARMFEPFFTTKERGHGSGLGLAMAYGTVAHHGGAIAVDSEVGRGTAITIYLPAVERVSPKAVAPPAAPPERRAALVLVVDDEPMVRSVTKRSLERSGYQVVVAGDGAEGVERFQELRSKIGLVLLDMAMPVMGGAECFRRLRAIDPDVRVLLASGYALEQEARDCLAAGALGFLEKPFTRARLLEAVGLALDGRRLDESVELSSVG